MDKTPQREIKYKVWDKFHKKFWDIIEIINFGTEVITVCNIGDEYPYKLLFKDAELLQYTGLKDKNGKEIYEGDLLTHNNNIYRVKFSSNQYVLLLVDCKLKTNWRSLEWCNNVAKYIEIAGNIYEHKHLLNEPKTTAKKPG